jgi:6-phosphogluconolactonase
MAVAIELLVEADAEAAAARAAGLLAGTAAAGGGIALSGGSTPRRAYELAADLEPDWSAADVWWADERCVPPEDDLSNYRLARETLLDRLARPPRAVHRIAGELGADRAAAAYDDELRHGTISRALLGVGPDGHTASLFPNAATLDERSRLAIGAKGPQADRVTLTLPALEAAASVVFLVTGADKADAVERAFGLEPSRETPASLVRSRAGRSLAVLDEAAAGRLSR